MKKFYRLVSENNDPRGYVKNIIKRADYDLKRFLKKERITNYDIYDDYEMLKSLRDNDTDEIKIIEFNANTGKWEIIINYTDI